jgi:hypothetical protein
MFVEQDISYLHYKTNRKCLSGFPLFSFHFFDFCMWKLILKDYVCAFAHALLPTIRSIQRVPSFGLFVCRGGSKGWARWAAIHPLSLPLPSKWIFADICTRLSVRPLLSRKTDHSPSLKTSWIRPWCGRSNVSNTCIFLFVFQYILEKPKAKVDYTVGSSIWYKPTFLLVIRALAILRDWIQPVKASCDKPSNVSFWLKTNKAKYIRNMQHKY